MNKKNKIKLIFSNDLKSFFWLLSLGLFIFGLAMPLETVAKDNGPKTQKSKKPKRPFPHGCFTVGYRFENKLLLLTPTPKDHPQSLYLLHNVSPHDIKLMQVKQEASPYIMHQNNKIKADQWASIATDKKVVKFICTKRSRKSKSVEWINCKGKFKICEYTRAKFASNNRGNYWAVSSSPRRATVSSLIRQGILLLW